MKILHLEDDGNDAELVRRLIESEWPGLSIVLRSRRADYIAALRSGPFDLILSDYTLPGFADLDALSLARDLAPGTPFVFLSGTIGEERAIDALRAGADDYVLKDRMKRLVPVVQRVLRDHDERRQKKQLEEQFLRVQRIENIGLLAAGIAHDLNNVLAPIVMIAPMLREKVTDPLDHQLLTTLERSAQRGSALVRQILSFAHGASGKPQLIQARHIFKDIAEIVAETFPKNILFDSRIPTDLWPIRANPTHIHQILLNLCLNARDAMPKGGSLRIRAENASLDTTKARAIEGGRPGSFLLLSVEDTGSGIAPEVLAQMWEPFFTTKGEGKGTGLGLSTVRGLVETCEGFIAVDTAVGRGTTFRLYLPSAAAEVPESEVSAETAGAPPARGKGELILIVDDEENVRNLASALLTRYGYRVFAVADGQEALRVFSERPEEISLVISDTHMPKLDGRELARALRRINPAVRILAMSGLSREEDSTEAEAWGDADKFLRKPFKPEALIAAVNGLISRPRA